MSLKNIIGLLLILTGLIYLVALLSDQTPVWNHEQVVLDMKEYDALEVEVLTVLSSSMDIVLTAVEDRDVISVQLHGAEKHKDHYEIHIDGGSHTRVNIEKHQQGWFNWGRAPSVQIQIPARQLAQIEVAATSGDMKLEGVQADRLHMTSSSGSQTVKRIQVKRLTMNASSGDMELSESDWHEAELRTGSGSVALPAMAGDRTVSVKTGSGDVSLDYRVHPADTTYTFRSGSGDQVIDMDVDLRNLAQSRHLFSAVAGEGNHYVEISTGSGDIEMRSKSSKTHE
ncbi:DUF4097 family beta strand repeat-containing protein [Marinicrinis sediminis]|uniref:DUF4097 domain-containing protein n=1 Tax=Marinicrinis sediminis TaxID=1652465 RepID=A0ABW5RGB9_9BACL